MYDEAIGYNMRTGEFKFPQQRRHSIEHCQTSLVPRPLPDLPRSRGEKSGEGLVPLLRHGPEMVDSILT